MAVAAAQRPLPHSRPSIRGQVPVRRRLPDNPPLTKRLTIFAGSILVVGLASTAHAQISFGIHIGEPPAPRAYRVPPRPGPDYVWVEGYQYPENGHYVWHDGYWTRPPYEGA